MYAKRVSGALTAAVLGVALTFASAAHAADLELRGAAWAAGSAGLLKVRATDHVLALEVPQAGNVSAVAVDKVRRVVWAYAQPNLQSYDFAGNRLTSTTIPGAGTESELAVRASDGSVWLSVDSQLHSVTLGGQLVRSLAGPGIVKELAVDGGSSVLWAATASKVTAHDAVTGAQIGSVTDLGNKPKVQDISMVGSDLWVALSGSLRWYKTAGATATFQQQKTLSGALLIDHVRTSSVGLLWAVKSNELVVLDFTDLILSTSSLGNPFAAGEAPVAVAAAGSSLWIATSASRLIDVGTSNVYLPISPPVTLRDVAVFPRETDRPSIAFTAASVLTRDPFLPVSVTYGDSGSGVDTGSLAVNGSGAGAVTFSCSAAAASATCTPVARYPEGLTTVQATVKDLAGNTSPAASMTVRVDTQPPSMAITSPADGTVLTTPSPTIAVVYSDTNGVRTQSFRMVAQDATISFACSVGSTSASCTVNGGLPAGTHTLTATIEDSAGNAGSAAVTVTLPGNDTTPPVLAFASPRPATAVADSTPLLRLSYSDMGMGVDYASLAFTIAGTPLAVSCMYDTTSAGCSPISPLPLGPVTVHATIEDRAGNLSPPASLSFSVVAPRTEVRGTVRRADGSPAAGATVFVVGKTGATTTAADGSFTLPALEARSGELLTVAARLGVGAEVFTGGSSVAPVLGGVSNAGTITLQPLCDFGFEDAFAPGDEVSGLVKAFAVFDDGSGPALYVGGIFQYIGGQHVGYVARWNGAAWSPLGSGLVAGVDGEVKALAVFDDGGGPALYVAGHFTTAGGQPASNVARWNGSTWAPLRQGTSNTVTSLAVFDDGSGPALYAGGGFLTAGGATVNRIARWDGFSWSALGGGVPSEVLALQVFDDGSGPALFAGGMTALFSRWSGTSWSALPSPRYDVYAMAAHAAGGSQPALFLDGGPSGDPGLARWDGQSLTFLSDTDAPRALLSFDDGRGAQLYSGTDGAAALVRWDGTAWRGVGGGLDDGVRSLGVESGAGFPVALVVSGVFDSASGLPFPGLVRWAPQCNPPDRKAPTIRIDSPAPSSTLAATATTVAGSVDEAATVTVDGQPVTLDAQRRFSKGPVALVEGANAFVVVAADAAGNSSRADVRVVRDTAAPTLRFVYPVQGQTLTSSLPRLELAFTDTNGIDARSLSVAAGTATLPLVCNAGADLLQCTPTAPLPTGSVSLTARVRDLAGNLSAAAQVTVTVAPSSASGTTSMTGVVELVGGAAIAGAQVFVLGQPGALAVSAADGAFTIAGVLATAGQPLTVVARHTTGGTTLVGFGVAGSPIVGGTTNVGRITLRPVCAAGFDQAFVAGYGVDGDYPWKFPGNADTHFAPQVRALAVYDDGAGPALFVGGTFKQAGGIPANFIAKFDGVRWSALGSAVRGGGMDSFVQALAVYNDGSGSALYAAGYFSTVDGQPISGIARWKGGAWSAVGGGITGTGVLALAVWNNALYAGGQFASAGGVAARNVARWNGTSWSALGNGLGTAGNMVYALVEHKRLSGSGTALWAGGDFTVSGSTAMRRVAVWDGNAWTEPGGGVGTGVDDYSGFFNVSSLGIYKSELYAGGWFSGAGSGGSVPAIGVARWDGRRWNAAGSMAVTGYLLQEPLGVQALAAFHDGAADALYALGPIDLGVPPRRDVPRWSGSAWSAHANAPFGSSFGGAALRAWDDPTDGAPAKLFAGSGITSLVATGQEVNGLATWDGAAWRPVGAGLGYDARALAVFDDGFGPALYAAGNNVKRMSRVAPPAAKASTWSQLPNVFGGASFDAVDVLAVLDAGNGPALYAAGKFTTPGAWGATSIARWDRGSWVPLGKSFTDSVTTLQPVIEALVTFDGPAGRVVVAAGEIGEVDGVDFHDVAQWDGATWRPVGTGVGAGSVYALLQHDDGGGRALYAGGDFAVMGGEPAAGIARWNGARWSAVGSNAKGDFRSLVAVDEVGRRILYAAGNLSVNGGATAQRVLRWDGASWSAIGAPFDGTIHRLAVADDSTGPALYAVGAFVKAGGVTVNRVARWDGTAWVTAGSDLGSGIVYDLASFDDGAGPALFAAGRFAYGSYGKKSDIGYITAAGEVYYLAKLRRPLQCSAPDTTAPTLSFTSPATGAVLDTQTPQLLLAYADAGSGVDTSSLQITADGAPLAVACSYSPSGASCTPSTPLVEGQVDLVATIRDAAGNVSAAAMLSFRVSVGAPSVSFTTPADEAVLATKQPRLTLAYTASSIPSTLVFQLSPQATTTLACDHGGNQADCDFTTPLPEGRLTVTATIENGAGATSEPAAVHFTVETEPPSLAFTAPTAGSTVRTSRPQVRLAASDAGTGLDTTTLAILDGAATLAADCAFDTTGATCTPIGALADGAHTLTATVRDRAGKLSAPATVTFTIDTSDVTPPAIVVTTPTLTDQPSAMLAGNVSEEATLTIDGAAVTVEPDLTFSFGPLALVEGPNVFHLAATDLTGNVGTLDLTITRATDPDVTPPEAVRLELVSLAELAPGEHRLTGAAGAVADEPGLRVVATNVATGSNVEASPAGGGGFELTLAAVDGDTLRLVARDAAGNHSAPGELTVSGTTPVPANPPAVAPPLDPSRSHDACSLVSFFWTGAARVQFGVRPEAIDCSRLAVVRGRVLDRSGAPIAGVRITPLHQPGYGTTFTRADGAFDIAVRAQERTIVNFSHAGYFRAQRTLALLAEQFTTIDDVVLVAPDSVVTTVDTSGTGPSQVVRGSQIDDQWGTRQTTILFPAGTSAALRLPSGDTQPIASMQTRVTELSVGASAAAAVPGTLPADVVLSHAMEVTVDAAEEAGAGVELSRPVAVYVENHLGAPVGGTVTLHTLDRTTATWVPQPPGRIVKVLAIIDGLAELDLTGSGTAASAEELQSLGIDSAERAQVAALYSPGQSLSRVSVTHFSVYVQGWFLRVQLSPILTPPVSGDDRKLDHSSAVGFGGTIEVENQILGQDLGITGTPYLLHYSSDRVPGRLAPYRLKVTLTPPALTPTLLALLKRIDLTIDIAGQHYVGSFAPAAGLIHDFVWDRQDGFGRELQGDAQWVATVSYRCGDGMDAFGATYTYSGRLGTLDAQGAQGLGGWTISANHFFDQPRGMLYYGDGGRRTLRSRTNNPHVIERVAGTGEPGSSGDGGPARVAKLDEPSGLSVAPDGSLLIADRHACRIRRVTPKDGKITTVAGGLCGGAEGRAGLGDGGPATAAWMSGPTKAVETADGAIYIADYHGHRIRRVDPNGIITTIAGSGDYHDCGVSFPRDVALTKDGALLIANEGYLLADGYHCSSIEKYTPGAEGLETVQGQELHWGGQHWGNLQEPHGVAVGPDGSVYFTPLQMIVKRAAGGGDDPQHGNGVVAGVLGRYASTGGSGDPVFFAGDGEPAGYDRTRFYLPTHLTVGTDGTIYVVDELNRRIRTISPAERVDTLVGGGDFLPVGNGLAARAVGLAIPSGVAIDNERGILYFADAYLNQVWKVRLGEAKADGEETVVPEEDGSLLYVFDRHGHHLRTEDAITGQELLTFTYQDFPASGGRTRHLLTRIEDPFGNSAQIQRGTNGDATGIVGPYGQATTLQIDGSTGYLQQASGGGSTVAVSHDAAGLLRSLTDPRSGIYTFDYDSEGRLSNVADPAGGSLTLTRTELPGDAGWKVRQQTAMGRASEVEIFLPPEDASVPTPLSADDRMVRVFTDAAGLLSELRESREARATARAGDGTRSEATLVPDPDPLLEDLAPYVALGATTTPAGLRGVATANRPEENPPGVLWSATATSNGRSATSTFTEASGTNPAKITQTLPSLRQADAFVDAFGRLTRSQVPGITPVEPTYDDRGRLSGVSQGARQSTWSYDPKGFVQSVTDPLLRTVSFERDARGRVTKQTLPGPREVSFGYDASGNLTSLTPPDRPPHTFGYTPVDQLETATPPDVLEGNDATSYAYNLDHQLELLTRPDGLTIDPVYDTTTGRLTAVTTPAGTTSYTYDPTSGRLASVTAPADGGTISYGYDGPVLTSVAQSGTSEGSVAYARDRAQDGSSNFWLASRTINGDATTTVAYQYDADGLLIAAGPLQLHRDASNGALTGTTLLRTGEALERNGFGEVTRLQSGFSDDGCTLAPPPFAGCTVILDQTYARDAAGRITGKTETLRDPLGAASETHTYAYTFDTVGRLTQVERDGAVWETYGYDTNSNRTSWTGPWGSGTASHDAQDRLLTYGSKTFTYTANGELATKADGSQTTRYTYDVLGNLRRVELPDGIVIDYTIDAANRRIAKRINGAQVKGFLYGAGSSPVAELDGDGNVVATFVYATGGNVPDAMVRGGVTYRVVTDHLGSVRWVLDAQTGEVAQQIDYNAFGRVTLDTSPGFQPFGFAGGIYDYQTGLVRFGARDYDSETGRWTSKDPIGFAGGDTNLYGYVVGDPVNFSDPSGLAPPYDFRNFGAGLWNELEAEAGAVVDAAKAIGCGVVNSTRFAGSLDVCPVDDESPAYQVSRAATPVLAALLTRGKGRTGGTRLGAPRNNPLEWRRLRNLWDETGNGHALSAANRQAIARGRTPVVDDEWIKVFPEDARYAGQQIRMHHIQGSPFTVPLPEGRHLDAHMPGGFRYNPGGPG